MSHGKAEWSSPSNIALVKYWGKHGVQLPANPSISFTLSESRTKTTLSWSPRGDEWILLRLDGESKPSFLPKVQTFFERVAHLFPWLKDFSLSIETSNTFPHSSGIASSASAMSALAMCLIDWESQRTGAAMSSLMHKASEAARLGSGSACRSVYGGFTLWGACDDVANSSDKYAVPLVDINDNFKELQDVILLVDKGEKEVSSTVGHGLMVNHPFADRRFDQARSNITRLLAVLKEGEFDDLALIMEQEALSANL